MKITVKNFGPIKSATNISVSPMTIFVGPSNTGKSYLAILIYSIIKTLGRNVITPFHLYNRISKILRENEALGAIIREISEVATENREKLSEEIRRHRIRIVEVCFSLWANIAAETLKQEIIYCFGEEGKQMIENGDDVVISITDTSNVLILNLLVPRESQLNDLEKKYVADMMCNKICGMVDMIQDDQLNTYDFPHLIYAIFDDIYLTEIDSRFISLLHGDENFIQQTFYLPAIRGGIMQIHRTIVSALIQRVPVTGLSDRFPATPLFTGILSDFMTKLVNIENTADRSVITRIYGEHKISLERSSLPLSEEIEKIGNKLEDRIIGGTIEVQSSETRYPDFRYIFQKDKQDHNLPLMSVSSMVSELAPVSLFIRHYILNGDLLVLEEPEAHLHPGAQRDISNALVQLVNAGVHVLITTHSSMILEQIGNCIQATKAPGTREAKRMNKAKQTLEEDKSSVYLFPKTRRGQPGNTVVKKIPFDSEDGILTQDHLDVSADLYNETVGLLNGGSDTDD